MRKYVKIVLVLALIGTFVCAMYFVWCETRDVLTVAFLDVGQGDAIFIETPNGRQMLIDGGPNRDVLAELSHVMPFYDRSIDVIINTHPDKDHIAGLPDVFRAYDVSLVLDPNVPSENATYGYYKELVQEEGARHVVARRGQVIDFGDGVHLRILFPDRDMSTSATNNASVIAQLVYGETEVLLTGDAPKSVETYLITLDGSTHSTDSMNSPQAGSGQANSLASDILKAGHHGSRTSSGEGFVRAVSPEYAVISAGQDNSYGHPHKEVLDVFNAAKVTILGTYEKGTIVFTSDGNTFTTEAAFR